MQKYQKSIIIGIMIGLVFFSIWAYFFDFSQLIHNLKNLNLAFLFISILTYISAYFVRSFRWNRLLKPIKSFKIRDTYLWALSGNFINYLIPIRAGEAARAIIIKKRANMPISLVLPSIFIDKFFDTVGIFIILAMIPFLDIEMVPILQWLVTILLTIFTIGILILITAIVAEEKLVKVLKRVFFFIPDKYQDKVFSMIELFVEGTALFKNHNKTFIEVIILTIVGIMLDGLYFYLMFKAFGFETMNVAMIFFGYTLLNLAYILPQPPGQLGSNELLMSIIFVSGMGMNYADAGSLIAVAHLLTGLVVSLLGILSLSVIGIRIIDLIDRRKNE